MITIEQVKTNQAVAIEQAKVFLHTDLKIIVNSGNAENCLKGVTDTFSCNGSINVGAMLEGLAQTDKGETLLKKVGLGSDKKDK